MDREVYDRMAEHDATHWWYVARRQILSRLIATEIKPPKGARILEVGCGTGRNLIRLARRRPELALYGVDASTVMLETAAAALEPAAPVGPPAATAAFAPAVTERTKLWWR